MGSGIRVVVEDPVVAALFERARGALAASELPVLIEGESGSGKELLARTLHASSPRASAPFAVLAAGGGPEAAIDAELFGVEGPSGARVGLVEAAGAGTLFVEEVAELSLATQAKLLRVLEVHTVRPQGSVEERPVACRFVGATQRRLMEEVDAGRFRRDLYYRLKGAILRVPPLRARPADVLALALDAITRTAERLGRPVPALDAEARASLSAHRWPGNVRELLAWAESTVTGLGGSTIGAREVEAWILPVRGRPTLPSIVPTQTRLSSVPERRTLAPGRRNSMAPRFRPLAEEVAELERLRMGQALQASKGNRTRAAHLIKMPLRTFATKLKQYGLEREGLVLSRTG